MSQARSAIYSTSGARTHVLGDEANLGGHTNLVTYFLFYTSPKESRIRRYIAGGAGIKVYIGLGPRFLSLEQASS